MRISKNLINVHAIKKRYIYLDKESKEKSTSIVKPKYKLAGESLPKELGTGRIFWISTSSSYTYPKRTSLKIKYPDNYDECDADPLKKMSSYFCIEKEEYLSEDEIFKKYNEGSLKKVAVLKQSAFRDFTNLRGRIQRKSGSDKTRIISSAINDEEDARNVLSCMGL